MDEVGELIDVVVLGGRFGESDFLRDLRKLEIFIRSAEERGGILRVVDRLELACSSLANEISKKKKIFQNRFDVRWKFLHFLLQQLLDDRFSFRHCLVLFVAQNQNWNRRQGFISKQRVEETKKENLNKNFIANSTKTHSATSFISFWIIALSTTKTIALVEFL